MNSPTTGEEAARLKRQGSEQAIALALESKWEEAANLNRTILAAHPSDVEAWNRLGKSLLELGRFREAHEAYGHSVQLDPVNTIAKRNIVRPPFPESATNGPTAVQRSSAGLLVPAPAISWKCVGNIRANRAEMIT